MCPYCWFDEVIENLQTYNNIALDLLDFNIKSILIFILKKNTFKYYFTQIK